MATKIDIKINRGEVNRMLQNRDGPVGRYIYRLAMETAMEARQRCPVKTGHLKASIGVHRAARNSMEVTANSPYALAVHQGTGPHVISSSKPMAFPSKKRGGRMVVVNKVNNPGTKANPFLMDALSHVISLHR